MRETTKFQKPTTAGRRVEKRVLEHLCKAEYFRRFSCIKP